MPIDPIRLNAGQINCCHHCELRHPGCHGSCETYLKARAEAREINRRIYEAKEKEKTRDDILWRTNRR